MYFHSQGRSRTPGSSWTPSQERSRPPSRQRPGMVCARQVPCCTLAVPVRKPVLLPLRLSSPRNGVLGGDLVPRSPPQSMSSPCTTPSHGSCAGTPPSPTTRHRSARSPTTTVSGHCACGSHGSQGRRQLPQRPACSGTLAAWRPRGDAAVAGRSRLCRLLGKSAAVMAMAPMEADQQATAHGQWQD